MMEPQARAIEIVGDELEEEALYYIDMQFELADAVSFQDSPDYELIEF